MDDKLFIAGIEMENFIIKWPWMVNYEGINFVDTDVLVIGGGIAGSWAALTAAKNGGINVALVEEADVFSAGPAGCDHYIYALDNPCCKIDPDKAMGNLELYSFGIPLYVRNREAYAALLEYEEMGAKVRDTDDEFKGAPFRDEETKLLFAYDYDGKHTIRVWGQTFRSALYEELLRRRVKIYNRIKVTSLLTEDGKQGSKVTGATGVHIRTGEFYVFRAKSTVLCTGGISSSTFWLYTGYRAPPSLGSPHLVGSGFVMAWRAGAEIARMEARGITQWAWGGQPYYAVGNPENTWYPCTIVDAKGKPVPWVTQDGKTLATYDEVVHPSLRGQDFQDYIDFGTRREFKSPVPLCCVPEFAERVKEGEYTLPLYADLSSMPEHERRAIFGLMFCQEGTTWIGYRILTQAGFDPNKDLLQCYGLDGVILDQMFRKVTSYLRGFVVCDWDFKTTLDGLYVAGDLVGGGHSGSVVAGRWAGAKAAEFAKHAIEPKIDERQVEKERNRVYAHVKKLEGISYRELHTAISRIMRVYCGDFINEEMLDIAWNWLKELEHKEAKELYARNPHELVRCLDVLDLLACAEIWILAAKERKASSEPLRLFRLDYPQKDPPEWRKFITLKQVDGKVIVGERSLQYWLDPPFAPTYKENYERHKPW
jgi:succinate dehydrogenase/fumarate reductase flavoprotein subunit